MAQVTRTTEVTETIYTTIITDRILRELRPMNVCRPFFRQAPAGHSLSHDFTLIDKSTGADNIGLVASVQSPTEGVTDLTNRNLDTDKARVTASVKAIMASITDLSEKVSLLDVMGETHGVAARSMAEEMETTLAALLSGFSNVSDAGASLDVATFLAAIAALEQRDISASLVSVVHPKQQGQLRSDIQSKTTSYWGNDNVSGFLDKYADNGYVGALFGVPIYQTSVVPTSDAAANRAGAIFVAGEALGMLELWAVKAETQRDASKLLTELVLSDCYGVIEISDTRGQTLKSDV